MKTLLFMFKSGSSVDVDMVTKWEVGCGHNGCISSLTVQQHEKAVNKLIVKSVNLSSIDCILEKP